jgi:hypothetical protein
MWRTKYITDSRSECFHYSPPWSLIHLISNVRCILQHTMSLVVSINTWLAPTLGSCIPLIQWQRPVYATMTWVQFLHRRPRKRRYCTKVMRFWTHLRLKLAQSQKAHTGLLLSFLVALYKRCTCITMQCRKFHHCLLPLLLAFHLCTSLPHALIPLKPAENKNFSTCIHSTVYRIALTTYSEPSLYMLILHFVH